MTYQIKMKRNDVRDIKEAVDAIRNSNEMVGGKFVCSEILRSEPSALMPPTNKAALLCYERYFRSQISIALLTIMIVQEDMVQKILIVGSGAGENAMDPGKTYIKKAQKIFEEIGFEVYTESEETPEKE